MPNGSLELHIGTLVSMLLVLARVAGVFTFVPLPGAQSSPVAARVLLALGFTIALYPVWPHLPSVEPTVGVLLRWLACEMFFGVGVGVAVALLADVFALAAQTVSLQAGFSYASTLDPNTQVDSGLLAVLLQLAAGQFFFSLGLDRQILRALATSLTAMPPGAASIQPMAADWIVHLGQSLLSCSIRLALPVIGLLLLVDLTLALVTKLNGQFQLLALSFPVKLLVTFWVLASMSLMYPRIFQEAAEKTIQVVARLTGAV